MNSHCPLCTVPASSFFKNSNHHFLRCPNCKGIFRDQKQLLDASDEKERYLHHKSGIEDTGYYQFVKPIIDQVKLYFSEGSSGLDFGCGHTPVLSEHLNNESYLMSVFDPIFFNDPSVFEHQFDFIVCCEVMEHFYHPKEEFKKLVDRLRTGGKLICKTHLYEKGMDFSSWYYKNDPSHVFIYQAETLQFIKDACSFKDVKIMGRVITFSK